MKIFKGKDTSNKYLPGEDSMADDLFGLLADNTCWYAMGRTDDKVYLVTSSVPGEGSTTIAVNLAIYLAKAGKKVLLIDANLRNPAVGNIFNIEDPGGLTKITSNGVSMKSVMHQTERYELYIIPSGSMECKPFDVITSQRLKDLVDEARKIFDFVVIDSTAVNMYPDTLLLCSLADQVVFVVLADSTEKSDIFIAKSKITDAGGKILGVILNRANGFSLIE